MSTLVSTCRSPCRIAAIDQLGFMEANASPPGTIPVRQNRKKKMAAYLDGTNKSVIQASLDASQMEQDMVRAS